MTHELVFQPPQHEILAPKVVSIERLDGNKRINYRAETLLPGHVPVHVRMYIHVDDGRESAQKYIRAEKTPQGAKMKKIRSVCLCVCLCVLCRTLIASKVLHNGKSYTL